jgi:hypothetical protein
MYKVGGVKGHRISFSGRSNRVKGACLIVLYHRYNKLGIHSGLTARELAAQAGCKLVTVKSSVIRWSRWHYLVRHETKHGYSYSIAQRGQLFCDLRMPYYIRQGLIQEIKATRTSIPG